MQGEIEQAQPALDQLIKRAAESLMYEDTSRRFIELTLYFYAQSLQAGKTEELERQIRVLTTQVESLEEIEERLREVNRQQAEKIAKFRIDEVKALSQPVVGVNRFVQ